MAPRRKKPRSIKSKVGDVLIIAVVLLVAAAVGVAILIQVKLNQINRVKAAEYHPPVKQAETSRPEESSEGSFQPEPWGEAGVYPSVEGVVNVLLVGQDTRSGERERSDTMIILSINQNEKQITMVSLMRDLYVHIPGYEDQKLNAAYQFGGFELLDQTIAENFGVVIDYNVEVNFKGFVDIVDTLGGIDMEMYQEEADYINGKLKQDRLKEGVNHLTGREALWYARTRKVGNADFERTERQREVLKTVYEKVKGANWFKLLKLYDSVADNLTTDMTNSQIFSIGFSAYSMGRNNLNSYRIPVDDTYHDEPYIGIVVDALVIDDMEANRALLRNYIYGTGSDREVEQALEDSSLVESTPEE